MEKLVNDFPKLLDFTHSVINSLGGKKEPDYRMLDCESFALKIFLQASTVWYLRLGTQVSLTGYGNDAYMVDFPSAFVIARSIFETYVNMFEIYFESISPDEFEYRHAAYQLRGFKIREDFDQLPKNPSGEEIVEIERRFKDIQSMRNRIEQTATYKSLHKDQQKSAREGGTVFPKRTAPEKARAAGFGEKVSEQVFTYFSAYVHGDALASAQISEANLKEHRRDEYAKSALTLVMMVLGHLIVNYAKKFPEAKAVCESNKLMFTYAEGLVNMANSLS